MTAAEPTSSEDEPSRPESLTVDFRESNDGLAVTTSQGGGPGGFLLLWEIAWTVGCVVLIKEVIDNPEPGMFLFAVPFWTAWLAVGGMLVWCFFGTETLLVRRDRVLFLRKAFITLSAREIPMSEVRQFRSCRSSYREDECYLHGIEVETIGKPVRFGFRLPARERQWLIWQLNRFAECVTDDVVVQQPSDREFARPVTMPSSARRLTSADVLDDPPTDSSWELQERSDGVEFLQRGRFQPWVVLGLLGINAFWNGIVGVFVLALFGLMPGDHQGIDGGFGWWGTFIFLIPFEVIGLVMLAGLVIALAEPFRRTLWRLDHHELVNQTRWPVIRMTRRWAMHSLDHLQLRQGDEDAPRQLQDKLTSGASSDAEYHLTFVSQDNVDQCSISSLTEGEARWMAGVLFDYRPEWSHPHRAV